MNKNVAPDARSAFQGKIYLEFGVFALLLFGIKLWLIATYANATPYWDVWDAEARNLYHPFFEGTLSWKDLFAAHNEHRILTTRLFDLALLIVNGIWNPLLEMVANAILDILMIICTIALLDGIVGRKFLPYVLVFSLFLFGIPFAWENTLEGFQTTFYFVMLFSVVSLWLTVTQVPLSVWWWVGIFCAFLAFFSLASGVLALAASAIVGSVFYVAGLRKTRKQLLAIAILGGLFILGWMLTPTVARHVYIRASSISQFLEALMAVLGWPIPSLYFSALILNTPNFIFSGLMLWKRPPSNDRRWFLLALVIWATGQIISIAYGRAIGHFSSRYMDLFSIGILVNFCCLISIVQGNLGKFNKRKMDGAIVWCLVVLASLGLFAYQWNHGELVDKRDIGKIEESNTRNYLATGDFSYLKDKPRLQIPYGNAQALASILAMPDIRAILPSNISPPLSVLAISESFDAFVQGGIPPQTPKRSSMTFGSFGGSGNGGKGQVSLQFAVRQNAHLAIPVAGYPLADGNKIEIVQNGQRYPLIVTGNPENSWVMAHANVDKGAFSIELSKSSSASWFAVEAPTMIGTFDTFIQGLLAHSIWFIVLGIVAGIMLLTYRIWTSRVYSM
jgi:hypothetical protein